MAASRMLTVFVARHAGRRFDSPQLDLPRGTRKSDLYRQLFRLTAVDPGADVGLEFAQLSLRRSMYLLGEMLVSEKRAPEAASLLARAVIEHALVGSYLAVTPGVSDRFIKKQAKHARRLRNRILTGDGNEVLDLLAESTFLTTPLAPALDSEKAAPDFAQIAAQLDNHEPFKQLGGLATLLYDESYSFLSNYVEHPTPLSLGRHRRMTRWLLWRRYRPSQRVHKFTLLHTAMPAVGALASCIARRHGLPHAIFDAIAAEGAHVDGFDWAGSPLRYATVTATLEVAGLNRARADLLGFLLQVYAVIDALRDASPAEQLVVSLEGIESGKSWRTLFLLLGGRVSPGLRSNALKSSTKSTEAEIAVAALYLAYAGVWPKEPDTLKATLEQALVGAKSVPSGALRRVIKSRPPSLRETISRQDAYIQATHG